LQGLVHCSDEHAFNLGLHHEGGDGCRNLKDENQEQAHSVLKRSKTIIPQLHRTDSKQIYNLISTKKLQLMFILELASSSKWYSHQ